MYVWIWRTLPGGPAGKVAGCAALFAVVVVLLMTVVFPWVEPRVPFNDSTVDHGSTVQTTPAPQPTVMP
jgi:hypothetical protein